MTVMRRTEAAGEARALVAEWIWAYLATDDAWHADYSPDEIALITAEVNRIRDRFEATSDRARFHRVRAERKSA
jgi:hypothetical protein